MNNSYEKSNLIYQPNLEKGEELFDGLPCPTETAFELLGNDGVEYIQNRLNEMLEWRKIMYGAKEKKQYGFTSQEYFVELRNKIVIMVGSTIQNEIRLANLDSQMHNTSFNIPKLVISNHLIKNDFKKLRNTNHYLIEALQKSPYNHPNINIPDFYRHHFNPNFSI